MHQLEFLNFDTNFITTTNPFDCSFVLSDPIRKAKKIYLKSIELPINFYNIRPNFNTVQVALRASNSNRPTFTLIIPNGNYTNITDILTILNNQINNIVFSSYTSDQYPQFALNDDNTITCSISVSGLTFSLAPSNVVNQILGFTNANSTNYVSSLTSARIYNLNYDNYLSIYIPNIPHKSNGFSNQLMTFKIPFNSVSGSIYYIAENISFTQYIQITDEHFIFNKLQIQVYDQFNNLLNNNGVNWSFTLAIEK